MIKNKITTRENWHAALKQLPTPHILQTWEWGALKARHGWQAERLLWQREQTPVVAAQLLTRRQFKLQQGYITKGPILDWNDMALVTQTLNELEELARQAGLLALKIDPDVRADTETGPAIAALLQERGWQPAFEQIQFRNTMLLDLRPELDDILLNMKSKWRYNIRLSQRKGVTVRPATVAELPLLYQLYAETAARDKFIIRAEEYYLDVWRTFMDAGLATPLLAEVENEAVAMLLLFHFKSWAWYLYGASRNLHRDKMPNHRLQWEALQFAKLRGCTTYDLWGAPDELEERDPLWGVYRFKKGFGAQFTPHIGAYDYAPHPLRYRLYAFLRPYQLKLAQRRYWGQQDN